MSDLPAILGGEKLFPSGPPSGVPTDPQIFASLQNAFQEGTWSGYDTGHIQSLEKLLGKLCSVSAVQTCASGTLAVETAMKSLRLPEGALVGMADYDYPGNFLAIHALGLKPCLIDLDPDSWQISIPGIESAIRLGIKALVVSHLHGGVVPMREVMAVCSPAGIGVIEDACQSPLAMVQGKPAGSWGDFGALSFGGSKLLSAGRGGAILSSKPDLAQRAKMQLLRGSKLAALSELQAIVLLPQLEGLPAANLARIQFAMELRQKLKSIPGLKLFAPTPDCTGVYYKLGLQLDANQFGLNRPLLLQAMQAEGIALDAGFESIHVHRSHNRWQSAQPLTESSKAHENALVLHHPILLGGIEAVEKIEKGFARIHKHAPAIRSLQK